MTIVDDHQIIRDGLREFIESRPGMGVAGVAGDRAAALGVAAREQPDIVVLDLDLDESGGLDLLPELLAAAPRAGVIILTGMRDIEQRDRAMELAPRASCSRSAG